MELLRPPVLGQRFVDPSHQYEIPRVVVVIHRQAGVQHCFVEVDQGLLEVFRGRLVQVVHPSEVGLVARDAMPPISRGLAVRRPELRGRTLRCTLDSPGSCRHLPVEVE